MIEFKNVSLSYGSQDILSKIECRIERGESIGVVGPNGSGKTTFLRSILGHLPAKTGEIQIAPTCRFAYVPQADEANSNWPLTVLDVIQLGLKAQTPFGRLSSEKNELILELMNRTGIYKLKDRFFNEISGGQRQRAILAQALCQKPSVLLLDEPTRGLDVVIESEFLNLVDDFQSNHQLTVILVTHTLQIPINRCQRIFLLNNGRLHTAPVNDVVNTRWLEAIYGVPFIHGEKNGQYWVSPMGGK